MNTPQINDRDEQDSWWRKSLGLTSIILGGVIGLKASESAFGVLHPLLVATPAVLLIVFGGISIARGQLMETRERLKGRIGYQSPPLWDSSEIALINQEEADEAIRKQREKL